MNLIEKGKSFGDALTIEELESIQGGVFCIKYQKCTGTVLTDSCGILLGNPDKDVNEG